MSNRVLREMDRANVQRVSSLEKRTNRLNNSVWPGAVRSTQLKSSNAASATPTPLVSVEVSRGRWLTFMRFTLRVEDWAPGDSIGHRVIVTSGPAGLLPASTLKFPTLSGLLLMPVADFGEFQTDEITTVYLETWTTTASTITWSNVSLFCLPV